MQVVPLERSELPVARELLAVACVWDRAELVAEEKLFGAAPGGEGRPFAVWDGDALAGVAAVAGNRVRVLATHPQRRRCGIGGALLEHCEAIARAAGHARLRTLDQPGNYLAPGIDVRNTLALGWLERRGWQALAEPRLDVLIDVRGNPRVSDERAAELVAQAARNGYEVRRARPDERALLDAVASEFGNAWPFEVERALGYSPAGVHVALRDGAYCGFAAHDGNNRGLGWFGPTGTWPAHRGRGLGEALLLACLVDVARDHARCEVAWIGPRPFYEKVAGIAADRRFTVLTHELGPPRPPT